ncbi:hypothetical protein [Micromonospora sp. 4G55]|uniref:hypothetical protein n=1 Tax=Micromonospora sp. 4G55 TaxID=2806102 RepID=UPI001A370CB5|nr:hypothetical protein [Micromonospora sp. 4G55]MBM0256355.1 hypothetical protein [Micromonospora sp. 4G55]
MRRDLELTRALYRAASGGKRHRVERLVSSGILVTRVRSVHRRYGHSTKASARLIHEVDTAYLAWWKGRVVGAVAIWRCGSSTTSPRLAEQPPAVYRGQSMKRCLLCQIENNEWRPA